MSLLLAGCDKPSEARTQPGADVTSTPSAPGPWWASPDDCRRTLETKRSAEAQGRARIGSWNVRWFPDGKEGDARLGNGTDVAWLACGIAALGVDVLGVQEFKNSERGKKSSAALITHLDRLTEGRWKLSTEKCGEAELGHVGLLWNSARVQADDVGQDMQPLVGEKCDLDWRPAAVGYFRFPGGFDTHIAVLHLPAGGAPDRMQGRKKIYEELGRFRTSLAKKNGDQDVILLGDLNTKGCEECDPVRSSGWEIEQLMAVLKKPDSGLRLLPTDIACSEYHDDAPYLLDHFVVSTASREIPQDARAKIDGYCVESKCQAKYEPDERDYYDDISDHCPLLLELEDRDLD